MGGFAIAFPNHDVGDQDCSSIRSQERIPDFEEAQGRMQTLQSVSRTSSTSTKPSNSSTPFLTNEEVSEDTGIHATSSCEPTKTSGAAQTASQKDFNEKAANDKHTVSQCSGNTHITDAQKTSKPAPSPTDLQLEQIRRYLVQSFQRDNGRYLSLRTPETDTKVTEQANWRVNTQNMKLINSALHEFKSDHFPSPVAKRLFFESYLVWYYNLKCLQGSIWYLDASQILLARELGIIATLPSLSEDELADRNKGDAVIKGSAIIQVVWLAVQLIARAANNRASSQIEVVTLAFSACAFVIYILLWNKPQDVQTPVLVQAT